MHKRHYVLILLCSLYYTSPNPMAYSTRQSTLYTRCLIAIQEGLNPFYVMVLLEALEFDLLPKELVKLYE